MMEKNDITKLSALLCLMAAWDIDIKVGDCDNCGLEFIVDGKQVAFLHDLSFEKLSVCEQLESIVRNGTTSKEE